MTQVATVIREIPKGRKGASVMQNGLTELQAAFVREYATDFCAKAAAIRAGYSEPSARQTGYMLLRNPVVRETGTRFGSSTHTQIWGGQHDG